METVSIKIDEIYVPVKRKHTLKPAQVEELAESILEEGLRMLARQLEPRPHPAAHIGPSLTQESLQD